jgi:hypothetical protein
MLPQNAFLKTRSVNGKSSLGIMQNAPPTVPCEIETDCDPGKVCHMSISVTGAPARELLKTLKERVSPNENLKQLGVTVYSSKDGLLDCDETDITKPFCRISFNPPQLKIEPAPICE